MDPVDQRLGLGALRPFPRLDVLYRPFREATPGGADEKPAGAGGVEGRGNPIDPNVPPGVHFPLEKDDILRIRSFAVC